MDVPCDRGRCELSSAQARDAASLAIDQSKSAGAVYLPWGYAHTPRRVAGCSIGSGRADRDVPVESLPVMWIPPGAIKADRRRNLAPRPSLS